VPQGAPPRLFRADSLADATMLFHTWTFAIFFLVTYAVYLALRRTRYWLHWLLIASYVFYGWWNPLYLLLILYSTLLDYFAVILIERSAHRKLWLIVSLSNNLVLLGFFKYAGFLTAQVNGLLALGGIGYRIAAPDILLPVGISFFTFQSMGYVIDCYRGHTQRERSFVRFAAFVSLFPQLVAGPIERSGNLLSQLRGLPPLSLADVTDGLSLFVVGLFKKVAIANYLAQFVDPIYAAPDRYNGAALAMATFAFAWQIYCDFSGYTDMARGVARMMGLRLILNFDHPYLATGLGDFWSRWHISLSSWFRDYVYVPLGGNRIGSYFTYRNLFLTMLISGLWHGASWTFVAWGAFHGLAYLMTRNVERTEWYQLRISTFVKRLAVFGFICFTWIFFRADNMADAWLIINKIVASPWGDPGFPLLALALVGSLWAYELVCESDAKSLLAWPVFRVSSMACMILYLCMVPGLGDVPFIYFQF
jgi:D-alanyl-lipoteichoic acid acyltransferase DltB (MBOAT superfamily)